MKQKLLLMMCTALLAAGLCSCEEIYQNKLEGTWSEQYDPFAYAMDGSVEYTFDGNGHYSLHTYDVLSGHTSDRSGDYALDLIGKNTITLNPFRPTTSAETPTTSSSLHPMRWPGKRSARPTPKAPGASTTAISSGSNSCRNGK